MWRLREWKIMRIVSSDMRVVKLIKALKLSTSIYSFYILPCDDVARRHCLGNRDKDLTRH